MNHRINVLFLPDYNVTFGQMVYPAADLSEQISTAGKEASGTGNMKFAMNGALTIGTLDGANIEISDAVGHENFFLFGLTAPQVAATKDAGYHPRSIYESNPALREVMDSTATVTFRAAIATSSVLWSTALLNSDPYLLFADYQSYVDCQDQVSATFLDQDKWAKMSIYNAARMGRFSSDRAIQEYCRNIWDVTPGISGRAALLNNEKTAVPFPDECLGAAVRRVYKDDVLRVPPRRVDGQEDHRPFEDAGSA